MYILLDFMSVILIQHMHYAFFYGIEHRHIRGARGKGAEPA